MLLAVAVAAVGELVRRLAARWSPLLASREPVERALLDLYLGGAVFYALAALPLGAFSLESVVAILVLTLAGWVYLIGRRRRAAPLPPPSSLRRSLPAIAAVASALVVLAVELAAVDGVGTGNTYDSSLLTTYVALLGLHHTLPLTLAPVGSGALAYPQGTTAWLAVSGLLLDLPHAQTSLLVTPLFLAAFPLAVYAAGRRLTGSSATAATLAVVTAFLAPWTRDLVFGSNDFVLAAPLVLVLAGWTARWTDGRPLGFGDALAFGLLLGYAAALNPVGPEWLLITLALLLLLARWRPIEGALALGVRARRYLVSLAAALVAVVPSLYALAVLRAPGPGGVAPSGIDAAAWVGAIDPFLFGPTDQSFSPFPVLRVELAALLVVGVGLCLLPRVRERVGRPLVRLLGVGSLALIGLLGLSVLERAGAPGLHALAILWSPDEESILLFELYGLLAAVPIVLVVQEALAARPAVPAAARAPDRPRPSRGLAVVVALALLAPGIVVTGALLPGELHAEYVSYGNVTAADFDLLDWAGAHLPRNATVLVAPGSAAEFLPGYLPTVRLVAPMSGGYRAGPPAYWTVVDELTNATLDARGTAALAALGVGYVAVTGANNVLFPPFSPAPLLAAGWSPLFEEDDAYLFAVPS